jgi:transposase
VPGHRPVSVRWYPDGSSVSTVTPCRRRAVRGRAGVPGAAEVNAELMSLLLAEVARRYPQDFILMVLDGAGWHKAGDLIVPAQMRLEWLPARSPELNPVEHVWEELREKWFGNRLFDEQAAVDRQVAAGLASLEKDPQRVASLAGFQWVQRILLNPKHS